MQDNTQAAENYSPPPISAAEAQMHEIYYKMTWREWQVGLRAGISHMTPVARGVWCALLLFLLAEQFTFHWLRRYSLTWPLPPLPPFPSILDLGFTLTGMLTGMIVVALLVVLPHPIRTARVTSSALEIRSWGKPRPIRWTNVTEILDTDTHIYFCQNFPMALVIPKHAFRKRMEAEEFLAQATIHWQIATGKPLSMTGPGVWLPAPSVGNSVEPGDSRKC